MAQGVHKITEEFEKELCRYTGAPLAVAVDNASNALFLALVYEYNRRKKFSYVWRTISKDIFIPKHTYPSVPCEILHAGFNVKFLKSKKKSITGCYRLEPTNIWDSALRFTYNMYIPGSHMCLSFTGPYKHLKLGKGGAILTDNLAAYKWFKKARFSGRDECSYFDDDFDKDGIIGWNFYMMPEIAARGLLLIQQFYDRDGVAKSNEDLTLEYPDLSKFKCYQI